MQKKKPTAIKQNRLPSHTIKIKQRRKEKKKRVQCVSYCENPFCANVLENSVSRFCHRTFCQLRRGCLLACVTIPVEPSQKRALKGKRKKKEDNGAQRPTTSEADDVGQCVNERDLIPSRETAARTWIGWNQKDTERRNSDSERKDTKFIRSKVKQIARKETLSSENPKEDRVKRRRVVTCVVAAKKDAIPLRRSSMSGGRYVVSGKQCGRTSDLVSFRKQKRVTKLVRVPMDEVNDREKQALSANVSSNVSQLFQSFTLQEKHDMEESNRESYEDIRSVAANDASIQSAVKDTDTQMSSFDVERAERMRSLGVATSLDEEAIQSHAKKDGIASAANVTVIRRITLGEYRRSRPTVDDYTTLGNHSDISPARVFDINKLYTPYSVAESSNTDPVASSQPYVAKVEDDHTTAGLPQVIESQSIDAMKDSGAPSTGSFMQDSQMEDVRIDMPIPHQQQPEQIITNLIEAAPNTPAVAEIFADQNENKLDIEPFERIIFSTENESNTLHNDVIECQTIDEERDVLRVNRYSRFDCFLIPTLAVMARTFPDRFQVIEVVTKKPRKLRFYRDYLKKAESFGKVTVQFQQNCANVQIEGNDWLRIREDSTMQLYHKVFLTLLDQSRFWRRFLNEAEAAIVYIQEQSRTNESVLVSAFRSIWQDIYLYSGDYKIEKRVWYFHGTYHHWIFSVDNIDIGSGSDVDQHHAYLLACEDAMIFLLEIQARAMRKPFYIPSHFYLKKRGWDYEEEQQVSIKPDPGALPLSVPEVLAEPEMRVENEENANHSNQGQEQPVLLSGATEEQKINDTHMEHIDETQRASPGSSSCISCDMVRLRKPEFPHALCYRCKQASSREMSSSVHSVSERKKLASRPFVSRTQTALTYQS